LARENEWEVQCFSHKVRLRDRVHMPPPGPTAAVGGGLAGTVAAAGVVWWWLRREPSGPAQTPRTFLAATAPRAMSTTRMRSFFMEPTLAKEWVRRVRGQ
jgi:hypothetical protein